MATFIGCFLNFVIFGFLLYVLDAGIMWYIGLTVVTAAIFFYRINSDSCRQNDQQGLHMTQQTFSSNNIPNIVQGANRILDRENARQMQDYLDSLYYMEDGQLCQTMFSQFTIDEIRAWARGRNGASRYLQMAAQRALSLRGIRY